MMDLGEVFSSSPILDAPTPNAEESHSLAANVTAREN